MPPSVSSSANILAIYLPLILLSFEILPNLVYTPFLLLDGYIEAEARTNKGRIDAVAACGESIIFKIKLN